MRRTPDLFLILMPYIPITMVQPNVQPRQCFGLHYNLCLSSNPSQSALLVACLLKKKKENGDGTNVFTSFPTVQQCEPRLHNLSTTSPALYQLSYSIVQQTWCSKIRFKRERLKFHSHCGSTSNHCGSTSNHCTDSGI